MPGSQE